MRLILACMLIGELVWPSASRAADSRPVNSRQSESVTEEIARKEKVRASELAAKYGVGEQDVQALRARGMAWEDIGRTLDVSRGSGAPAFEIAELHESGAGWEAISERYGLKPRVAKNAGAASEGMRDAVGQAKSRVPMGARDESSGKPRRLKARMLKEEKAEGAKSRKSRNGRIDARAERGLLRQ